MSRLWLSKFHSSAWALDKCIKTINPNDDSRKLINDPLHALRFCLNFGKDDEMKEIVLKGSSTSYAYARLFGHDETLSRSIEDSNMAYRYCVNVKNIKRLRRYYNMSNSSDSVPSLILSIIMNLIPILILGITYYFKVIFGYGILSTSGLIFSFLYLVIFLVYFGIIHNLICKGKRVDSILVLIHNLLRDKQADHRSHEIFLEKLRHIDQTLRCEKLDSSSDKALNFLVINRDSWI